MQHPLLTVSLSALCILAGCASQAADKVSAHTVPLEGRRFDYRCNEMRFVAEFWPDRVVLRLPAGERVLPQVVSASGAKYQRGEMLFWTKGNDAILVNGARSYTDCRVATR